MNTTGPGSCGRATLHPAHLTLIDALAEIAVEEYLTVQAARQQHSDAGEAERALPGYDRAA